MNIVTNSLVTKGQFLFGSNHSLSSRVTFLTRSPSNGTESRIAQQYRGHGTAFSGPTLASVPSPSSCPITRSAACIIIPIYKCGVVRIGIRRLYEKSLIMIASDKYSTRMLQVGRLFIGRRICSMFNNRSLFNFLTAVD